MRSFSPIFFFGVRLEYAKFVFDGMADFFTCEPLSMQMSLDFDLTHQYLTIGFFLLQTRFHPSLRLFDTCSKQPHSPTRRKSCVFRFRESPARKSSASAYDSHYNYSVLAREGRSTLPYSKGPGPGPGGPGRALGLPHASVPADRREATPNE